jgi:predicted nucleotidyltransferase
MMARIDPSLVPVVSDLVRGLRELEIPFGIVGALVPELLLDARPRRMTNDADVAVTVASLADFDTLKERLAEYGFKRTRLPHRLQHRNGGLVDILPFSKAIAPDGHLELQEGFVFNMAGFAHVVPNAIPTTIDEGPTVPVAPLPLYVLLKLVAFSDRKAPKDLDSVFHCLGHYAETDRRRFTIEHDGDGVPYEYTSAYLLGLDARPFLDQPLGATVRTVLDRLGDPEMATVGIVAREERRFLVDDGDRVEIVQRFRWYRLGTGL